MTNVQHKDDKPNRTVWAGGVKPSAARDKVQSFIEPVACCNSKTLLWRQGDFDWRKIWAFTMDLNGTLSGEEVSSDITLSIKQNPRNILHKCPFFTILMTALSSFRLMFSQLCTWCRSLLGNCLFAPCHLQI